MIKEKLEGRLLTHKGNEEYGCLGVGSFPQSTSEICREGEGACGRGVNDTERQGMDRES